jgi:hypothetical protein
MGFNSAFKGLMAGFMYFYLLIPPWGWQFTIETCRRTVLMGNLWFYCVHMLMHINDLKVKSQQTRVCRLVTPITTHSMGDYWFVKTGTYFGWMVTASRESNDTVIIVLDEEGYINSPEKFGPGMSCATIWPTITSYFSFISYVKFTNIIVFITAFLSALQWKSFSCSTSLLYASIFKYLLQ